MATRRANQFGYHRAWRARLAEAERYTREADRRRGGRRAIVELEDHKANRTPNPLLRVWGNQSKAERFQVVSDAGGAP